MSTSEYQAYLRENKSNQTAGSFTGLVDYLYLDDRTGEMRIAGTKQCHVAITPEQLPAIIVPTPTNGHPNGVEIRPVELHPNPLRGPGNYIAICVQVDAVDEDVSDEADASCEAGSPLTPLSTAWIDDQFLPSTILPGGIDSIGTFTEICQPFRKSTLHMDPGQSSDNALNQSGAATAHTDFAIERQQSPQLTTTSVNEGPQTPRAPLTPIEEINVATEKAKEKLLLRQEAASPKRKTEALKRKLSCVGTFTSASESGAMAAPTIDDVFSRSMLLAAAREFITFDVTLEEGLVATSVRDEDNGLECRSVGKDEFKDHVKRYCNSSDSRVGSIRRTHKHLEVATTDENGQKSVRHLLSASLGRNPTITHIILTFPEVSPETQLVDRVTVEVRDYGPSKKRGQRCVSESSSKLPITPIRTPTAATPARTPRTSSGAQRNLKRVLSLPADPAVFPPCGLQRRHTFSGPSTYDFTQFPATTPLSLQTTCAHPQGGVRGAANGPVLHPTISQASPVAGSVSVTGSPTGGLSAEDEFFAVYNQGFYPF